MKPYIHLLFIGLTFGALIGYGFSNVRNTPKIDPEVKVDTLFIRDTIDRPVPVPVASKPVGTIKVPVPVHDTLRIKDTLYVPLQKTQKTYMSPDYYAWVSGVEPNLDSLKIFRTTTVVTKEIKVPQPYRKKWGISITVGPGVVLTPSGDVKGGFAVAGGLSYTF